MGAGQTDVTMLLIPPGNTATSTGGHRDCNYPSWGPARQQAPYLAQIKLPPVPSRAQLPQLIPQPRHFTLPKCKLPGPLLGLSLFLLSAQAEVCAVVLFFSH